MSVTSVTSASLLDALDSDHLVITPNRRLLRRVQSLYQQHCQQQGLELWRNPKLFSLQDWLQETWQRLLDAASLECPRVLMTRAQEQLLWQTVIEEDERGSGLINPLSLAQDAATAYRSLLLWRLQPEVIERSHGEPLPICQWLQEFEAQAGGLAMVTLEQAQKQIIDCLAQGALARESHLLAIGFDDIPPLTSELFEQLAVDSRRQASVSSPRDIRVELVRSDSEEAEVQAAASWALATFERQPNARIGIIVPNLGQSRVLIERVFTATMEPHYSLPQTSRYTLPFNFSAGTPLGNVPLIADTLQLLRLNQPRWPLESLINLLNSPFWGLNPDLAVIDALARRLRRPLREFVTTGLLRREVHRLAEQTQAVASVAEADCQGFAQWLDQALQQFESQRRQHRKLQLPSQWAQQFESQLRCLGWPGQRRPDSNEYQQLTQWYQLLEEFARFDLSLGVLQPGRAIEVLGQLALGTHFQAQTPDSPIQILGVLEGAGLEFSHCWVLGMAAKDWPPSPSPNPLLPVALQRQYDMPHADAARELQFATALTQHYRRCATQVIFSFAAHDQESEQPPSALVADIAAAELPQDVLTQAAEWVDYQRRMSAFSEYQWLNIGSAPPLTPAAASRLRGGGRILRDQAVLPAAAFAIHRLCADQPLRYYTGLTPLQRGQLLHDCLADFWTRFTTSNALLQLDEQQLRDNLVSIIAEQLRGVQKREPGQFGLRYLEIESQRLLQLLMRWLGLEATRPPFEVIAIEQAFEGEICGIPLHLRLDRLDRVGDGQLLLLDYKSGKIAARSWAGMRPEDPQLPLYSITYPEKIDAIAFAGINALGVKLIGVGDATIAMDGMLQPTELEKLGLPGEWQAIIEHWRGALHNLASEFLQGDCGFYLSSRQQLRFFEHLGPLLRLQEAEDIERYLRQQGSRQ